MTEAGYLSDLVVRVLPPRTWAHGRKWELAEPLRFRTRRFRGTFIVPAGFVTDFASIPRGLWNLYPKDGPWLRAAVLHDAGYEHALHSESGLRVNLIRRYCDELFDEAMAVDGVPAHRRALFCAMVGLFGDQGPAPL